MCRENNGTYIHKIRRLSECDPDLVQSFTPQVLSKSDCQYWAPFQHIFFQVVTIWISTFPALLNNFVQLAHFGLVLSCLAPVGTIGLLCLRAFLLVAFALYRWNIPALYFVSYFANHCHFLSAWGFSVACSLDTALWGLLLTLINLCWVTGLQQNNNIYKGENVLLGLAWRVRPVKLDVDMEEVYSQLFLPLKVEKITLQKAKPSLFSG